MTDIKQIAKANSFRICNRMNTDESLDIDTTGAMGCKILLLSILLLIPAFLYAQDDLREVPNPDPQFELQALHAAEGLEVNLFAEEPMLVKPIQMNWDAKGRLWVVGSKHYPQLKPGQIPDDKIYVLEDTTGDGRADVSTVFAEGLHIPTGILPGDGGAYVANSTEILHLKDTNGDGKADQRRRILSGFGTGDTHHLIHTFRWGPAGRFHFNQAIYIHSRIETSRGLKELKGGGVWRFQPETMELDVYSRGSINPWGLRFNKWGQSFLTDGAGREGINYAFPGATFVAAPGAERILEGLNPGQPKHSGLEIISGRHFPDSLQGSFITNDFRANRINRFVLEEQGSGYVSKQVEDLLWSDNVAFRPVDISVGPDGAIYVADWYNPIIQHGEVDFRDPRRDHQHGRIWRITAKDRPLVKKPQLSGASTTELLDALKKPEKWTRSQARRLLKERGAEEIVPLLKSWISNLNPDNINHEHLLLEALWVFQSVDVVNETLLKKILNAEKHQVRAAAVRVLNYWYDNVDDAYSLLEHAIVDNHPKVRQEAVIGLRNEKTAKAASTALSVLDSSMDKFLDFALWQTIRELEPYWMDKIETDAGFFGDPRKTAYALKSVNNPQAVTHLLTLYEQEKVPEEYNQDVFESVAQWGSAGDLNTVLDLAMSAGALHKERRAAYLEVLEEAARQQEKKPAHNLDRISRYLEDENPNIAQRAIRLVGYWNLQNFREKMGTLAQEGEEDIQKAALDALAALGDEESLNYLIQFSDSDHSTKLRLMATQRLVTLDVSKAAAATVKILQDEPNKTDTEELFSAFFNQQDGIQMLADELSNKELPKPLAMVGRKAMQRHIPFNRKEDEDVQALKKYLEASGGTLPPERMPQDLSNRELNRLEVDIKASADPAHGEQIFRKLACTSCHAIGGAGGVMGPDLSSLGANAPTDYIIEGLLNPSADIKDGYELHRVARDDGTEIRGYVVKETSTELVLRDIGGHEVSIPQSRITSHETVSGSLMPPGLTASIERKEFIDLVGFLSKIGEPGEYRVPNNRYIRSWNVLKGDKGIAENIRKGGVEYPAKRDGKMEWTSAYSKVTGDLPIGELPVLALGNGRMYSFVTFQLEVLAKGNIDLLFNSADGISIWADEKLLKQSDRGFVTELPKGVHTFTLAIDHNSRKNRSIAIQISEASDLSARTKLVVGE